MQQKMTEQESGGGGCVLSRRVSDEMLVSRDCLSVSHSSIHYTLCVCDAEPVYLTIASLTPLSQTANHVIHRLPLCREVMLAFNPHEEQQLTLKLSTIEFLL